MSRRKSTEATNAPRLPWKTFGAYVEARAEARDLSRRQLALALGLDPAHLTRLVNGKIHPSPETCRRLAEYFGDPPSMPLRLAGWVTNEDFEPDDLMHEFIQAFQADDDLRTLLEIYLEQATPAERHAMVRLIQAAFGKKKS